MTCLCDALGLESKTARYDSDSVFRSMQSGSKRLDAKKYVALERPLADARWLECPLDHQQGEKGDLAELEPTSCQRVRGWDGENKGAKPGGLANATTPPQS